MIIKLTEIKNGHQRPIYVNTSQVKYIYKNDENLTLIYFGKDDFITVKDPVDRVARFCS